MKFISKELIVDEVSKLCIEACTYIDKKVLNKVRKIKLENKIKFAKFIK